VYINGFILSASYLRDYWNEPMFIVQTVIGALQMYNMIWSDIWNPQFSFRIIFWFHLVCLHGIWTQNGLTEHWHLFVSVSSLQLFLIFGYRCAIDQADHTVSISVHVKLSLSHRIKKPRLSVSF